MYRHNWHWLLADVTDDVSDDVVTDDAADAAANAAADDAAGDAEVVDVRAETEHTNDTWLHKHIGLQ